MILKNRLAQSLNQYLVLFDVRHVDLLSLL
jgi:hypothetical protein